MNYSMRIIYVIISWTMVCNWKSKFLYRYRPEGIFRFFFGLILDPPPGTYAFYSEKRQIHLYRPFFSPWHGPFRKKGGTGAGIRFYFPCVIIFCQMVTRPQLGPFFVLKFVRSRVLGRDFFSRFQILSDRKVLFKHKNGR